MKVHELISLLRTMPPDHDVIGEYDDIEYGDTQTGNVSVSLNTVKLTEEFYHREGPIVRYSTESGSMIPLPFTTVEVVLLRVG